MAASTLSNVDFQSSEFKQLFYGYYTHRLALLNSLFVEAPDSMISPDAKGYTVSIPYIDPDTGDSVQITTSLTTTVNALNNWKDIAAWVEREKAWGSEQIVKVVSGYDLTDAIAKFLANYWAAEVHKSGVSVLTGAFATALLSTHVYTTDAGTTINAKGLQSAKQAVLGDNSDLLDVIVMNSKVHSDAVKDGLETSTPMQDQVYGSGNINRILGMEPYITDKLTATSSVYPTYLAQRGSMIYKFRNRTQNNFNNANVFKVGPIEVELYRSSLTNGGQDVLITRASYLAHIPGVQFDGTVTSNPTNTELATGTTWTKIASDDKYIKIVKYESL
jgi:hypothetical protein